MKQFHLRQHRKTGIVFGILFLFLSTFPRLAFAQKRYDVLITECLPDPSPVIGLPESSFIELTNRSTQPVNLRNWTISNGTTTATIRSDQILKPDSILILCSTAASGEYGQFGSVLGISNFPALGNEEDEIILKNETDQVIHAIHYNKTWFHNDLKADGGWGLEMIDLSNPAGGENNWSASIAIAAGSPGQKNSTDSLNPDHEYPSLIRANAVDSLRLELIMDEAIDSISGADVSNYLISDEPGAPVSAFCVPPFFNKIQLTLPAALLPGKIYSVEVDVMDVCANGTGIRNHCVAGIPKNPVKNDVIFNEILFNPPPYGFDYIEILNRSSKIIDLSALYISGREAGGALKDPVALTFETRSLFPGEYLVLSENPDWVLQQYPQTDATQILLIKNLPSMPDDAGDIALLDQSGTIIDELSYDHRWHSPMLASEEAVSLERIRPGAPTDLSTNWASAASDVGYGTPGYKNSESFNDSLRSGELFITANTKIFSPDMDGYQDFCFLQYHLPGAGFSGSISIYDISGNRIRELVNNNLWGKEGMFRWDGLDDQSNPLATGHYIIYAEIWRPDGIVKTQKIVVALVRNRRK